MFAYKLITFLRVSELLLCIIYLVLLNLTAAFMIWLALYDYNSFSCIYQYQFKICSPTTFDPHCSYQRYQELTHSFLAFILHIEDACKYSRWLHFLLLSKLPHPPSRSYLCNVRAHTLVSSNVGQNWAFVSNLDQLEQRSRLAEHLYTVPDNLTYILCFFFIIAGNYSKMCVFFFIATLLRDCLCHNLSNCRALCCFAQWLSSTFHVRFTISPHTKRILKDNKHFFYSFLLLLWQRDF